MVGRQDFGYHLQLVGDVDFAVLTGRCGVGEVDIRGLDDFGDYVDNHRGGGVEHGEAYFAVDGDDGAAHVFGVDGAVLVDGGHFLVVGGEDDVLVGGVLGAYGPCDGGVHAHGEGQRGSHVEGDALMHVALFGVERELLFVVAGCEAGCGQGCESYVFETFHCVSDLRIEVCGPLYQPGFCLRLGLSWSWLVGSGKR